MQFLELISTMRAEEASKAKLFGREGVRTGGQNKKAVAEAVKLVEDVYTGRKSKRAFLEAMSTDDFPKLFGDVLNRQVLASYRATPAVFRNFVKISTVPDFRDVKRFAIDGGDSTLKEVKQSQEYPVSALSETEYSYSVKKYGRRMPFSWESIINDDLEALKDIPQRFGRAARRSEQKFATGLYVGDNGPKDTLFDNNRVPDNAELDIDGLSKGIEELAKRTDADGEPIAIDTIHLVVPPALEVTAMNLLQSLQLELNNKGGSSEGKLVVANWIKNRVTLHVDPYIPVIADNNGETSWFLFADPSVNRPALEMGFLRGFEEPQIFMKSPNAEMVGGGVDPMIGDFDIDAVEYKVRHVFGGTEMDSKMAIASDGTGS